jgi:hypothetical protein
VIQRQGGAEDSIPVRCPGYQEDSAHEEGVMALCDVGFENKRSHGSPITIDGKQYLCPHGTTELLQWVLLPKRIDYGPSGIFAVCVDCYKKLYGSNPMPSDYKGHEYGRLMTKETEEQEWQEQARNYMLDPAVEAQLAAQAAPAAVPSSKPPRLRMGGRFFPKK